MAEINRLIFTALVVLVQRFKEKNMQKQPRLLAPLSASHLTCTTRFCIFLFRIYHTYLCVLNVSSPTCQLTSIKPTLSHPLGTRGRHSSRFSTVSTTLTGNFLLNDRQRLLRSLKRSFAKLPRCESVIHKQNNV